MTSTSTNNTFLMILKEVNNLEQADKYLKLSLSLLVTLRENLLHIWS